MYKLTRALPVALILLIAQLAASPAAAVAEEQEGGVGLIGETEDDAADEEEAEADVAEDEPERRAERGPFERVVAAPLSASGAPGLNRVISGRSLDAGTFGFSLFGQFLSASDFVVRSDDVSLMAGSVSAAYSPLDWLTVYAQMQARSASNSRGRPELIQSIGDFSVGALAAYEVIPGLYLGGTLNLLFPTAADRVGVAGSAISTDLLTTTTFGVHEVSDLSLPLWFHLNLGVLFDRGDNLFDVPLGPTSRFGHNIHDYNRFRMALGVELEAGMFAPFAELVMDAPLAASCNNALPQACVIDNGFSAWPAFLSVGTRFAPHPIVALLAGFEFGLTTSESQGTPAVPAWSMFFGASFHIDPRPVAPEVVEVEPEEPEEPAASEVGWLAGAILDQQTDLPIEGVRISFEGIEWSAVVTDDEGQFRTPPLPAGESFEMHLEHPRYRSRTLPVNIREGERHGDLKMALATELSRIQGVVRVRENSALIGALVAARGETDVDLPVDPDTGRFLLELEPGRYQITVSAPGHHALRETLDLDVGHMTRNVELRPLQRENLPRWSADAIVFDSVDPEITFDGLNLSEEGTAALTMVARLITASDASQILIRMHTDDVGDVEAELDLLELRSMEVMDALIEAGLSEDQLDVELVGSEEPLYPNVNDRNRERNNRVEFIELFIPE